MKSRGYIDDCWVQKNTTNVTENVCYSKEIKMKNGEQGTMIRCSIRGALHGEIPG